MITLNDLIRDLLVKEGGFTDDPDDSAHQLRRAKGDKWDSFCTNMGITQATLSDFLGRQATAEEVRGLRQEVASAIFVKRYYNEPKIDLIHPIYQPKLLDMSVNHGASRGIIIFQRCLTARGFPCDDDGKIGPQTARLSHSAERTIGAELINDMVTARNNFYHELVRTKPSNSKYLKGWLRRSDSFRVEDKKGAPR